MVCPFAVVQVEKRTTNALVEDGRTAQCKALVAAKGEARGVDGTGLGWAIELELKIGSNIASATVLICQDGISETKGEDITLFGVSIRAFRHIRID
jgi:hypothetical protein